MSTQDILADPLIIAGVTLFIVAAAVMAVLMVIVRGSALLSVPKLPFLDAISSDRRRIAHEIRQDPVRFLTPKGTWVCIQMRQAVWWAAGSWIMAFIGVVI